MPTQGAPLPALNSTVYQLYAHRPVLNADGSPSLIMVAQAGNLVELFIAIPKLGLAGKPHIIVASTTIIHQAQVVSAG